MMKKILSLVLFIVAAKFICAQEVLNNLSYNPALYYSTKAIQPHGNQHRYLVDRGNTIITTDTLTLPFVDDFSSNRLRSYKWIENHTTDTFFNVYGTCLGTEGIATLSQTFSKDTAWFYTLVNAPYPHFDSVPQDAIQFTFFGISTSNCFSSAPQTFYYWNQYYAYSYDTATNKIDSVLVTDSTINLNYAPVVYFAQGETGTLWFDNYAYVNNTYPINPPTIGVATLDGLNEYGLPYNSNPNSYGNADYLTSKPIDLSAFTGSDSIYLSFFYEAQGLGDYPDRDDSLIVEFKNNAGEWQIMWNDTGYSSPAYVPQQFKQIVLYVHPLSPPYSFYHSTFQFRFRNKASLFGNNDHWHIDYVRLDKNRFAQDTNIVDIAFIYPFPTILKNFTEMPADQFNYTSDLRDTIQLIVRNNDVNADLNPPATNFGKDAVELYPSPVVIAPAVLQTFNAGSYNQLEIYPATEYAIPVANTDSLVLLSRIHINPNDAIPQNDTLFHVQNFGSLVAYDDGTAERAYGISGIGLKKFAYEFNLNHPDTLAAFQIQFAQVDGNVSNLVFNFQIWDSLKIQDVTFKDDSFVIFSMENRTPFYIDSVNGFTTYKLDTPILVPQKFYFGWVQTDTRNLQVGFDLNSKLGKPHMYYYTDQRARWSESNVTPEGSPMIRLILDSAYLGESSSTVGVNMIEDANNIQFFPNPTSGVVFVHSEKENTPFEISVINIMGQQVKFESDVIRQFSISELPAGVYLLSARDKNGKISRGRIIKE